MQAWLFTLFLTLCFPIVATELHELTAAQFEQFIVELHRRCVEPKLPGYRDGPMLVWDPTVLKDGSIEGFIAYLEGSGRSAHWVPWACRQQWQVPNSYRALVQEVGFIAPSADQVPGLMQRYSREAVQRLRSSADPYRIAAYLHHGLILVHPFRDGNGRCARLLVNRYLAERGLPQFQLKDRRAYVRAQRGEAPLETLSSVFRS